MKKNIDIYNINDKKNLILLSCFGEKSSRQNKEKERLLNIYGQLFKNEFNIAFELYSQGLLDYFNPNFDHDADGNEIKIPIDYRFCITELGINVIKNNLFISETQTILDEKSRSKWADRRSWIALVISLIAVIISLLT